MREVVQGVIAASGRDDPNHLVAWLRPCEVHCDTPDTTFSVDNCRHDLRPLDSKLAVALCSRVKSSKYPGLINNIERLSAMAHQNYTTLSGRRVYYEVLHHLRVNDGRGMMNALVDLGKLPFPGDTPEQLTKWAHNVASLARRAEAEGSPHNNIYYAIRECLRHSKSLDYKREVYEQMNIRDLWRWPHKTRVSISRR